MAHDRHSFVAFYPSDWIAGTARLPRLHASVYFDICCSIWDTAKPVTKLEARMMLSDLPDYEKIIEDLIEMGKLERLDDGSISNPKALAEATKAYTRWEAMSKAGKKGAKKPLANGVDKGVGNGDAIEPEPEPEPEPDSLPDGKQQPHERVFEAWNKMAEETGILSVASKMTDKRKTALRARLKDFTVEQIIDAIWSVQSAPFLLGRGERGFKASLDFVLQAKSLPKLIEGDYHGRTGKASGWLER